MGYYGAGDNIYGRGDYYHQGDFFGFIKKAANFALKNVPIVGQAYSAISTGLSAIKSVASGAHPSLPKPAMASMMLQAPQIGIVNTGVGGGGGAQVGLINTRMGAAATDLGPLPTTRGYHLNKSTYESRGGGTSRWPRELELHPKHTVLVRNRRMNVGNARALKHSLRRVRGFAHLARQVMSFVHPHAGRGHFKFGKRKKR